MSAPEILPPLGHQPLPPMPFPILVTDDGEALLPDGFTPGLFHFLPVCNGVGIAWAPLNGPGSVLISLVGGNDVEPTGERMAFALTRGGLRDVIRDLQSIEQQLGADQ